MVATLLEGVWLASRRGGDVRDGIGISPADRQRIFEPFVRAASTDYGGLGLGLYIARRLVELHGGALSVESELGGGQHVYRHRTA